MHFHKGVLERYLEAVQHTDNATDCWLYQRTTILRDLKNAPLSVTADTANAIKQIDELRRLIDSLGK